MNQDELIKQSVPFPHGAAWLVRRKDGGPIRAIATGRRRRPVGLHCSVKCGRMLPWESRVELHALWRADVRSDVAEMFVQPFRLEVLLDGRTFHYTCDRKDLLASGHTDIVEVKDILNLEKDPLYDAKLRVAATIFADLGWSFRIEDRAEIEAEPAFSTIRTVQMYARTAVMPRDIIAVQEVFGRSTTAPLNEVQLALGGGVRGFAAVCALVVRRRLALDPAAGLAPDTPLRITLTQEAYDA